MIYPIKTLVDTNILMSPLTCYIFIELEKINLISMFINKNILKEYEIHGHLIKSSPLKVKVEKYINSECKICEYNEITLSNNIKIKDKGDKHLLIAAISNHIEHIVSFDKNPFYKSSLKELELKFHNPQDFILLYFSDRLDVIGNCLDKLEIPNEARYKVLKEAQLKKLARYLGTVNK